MWRHLAVDSDTKVSDHLGNSSAVIPVADHWLIYQWLRLVAGSCILRCCSLQLADVVVIILSSSSTYTAAAHSLSQSYHHYYYYYYCNHYHYYSSDDM